MRASRIYLTLFFFALLGSSCGGNSATSATSTAAPVTDLSKSASPLLPTDESFSSPNPGTEPALTESQPVTTVAPTGLNPAGPYAVFEGEHGIWIANPDGSFPTRIAEQGAGNPGVNLPDVISPRGDRIAATVIGETGVDLVILDVPSGRKASTTRLIDITRRELRLNSMSPKAFAYYAITGFPNLAWQSGSGAILAYTGMGNGTTADMYTVDLDWEKVRHLEQDPSQAVSPIWSPDGSHLLFFGVEWLPPFGATYITFQPMAGFWAARASDNQLLPQTKLKGTYQNFTGWQDNTHYLVFDSSDKCIAQNLRAVDLLTGEETPIADFCLSQRPAFSPANRALLISVDADCGCGLEQGVYRMAPPSMAPTRLLEKPALDLFWLPESGLFYAYPDALFSADGNVRFDPPVIGSSYRPAVSKNGAQAWVVLENHRSRVVLQIRGGEWKTLLEGSVSAMLWDPLSGDTLLIVLESGSLYSATGPDFTPRLMGDLGGYYDRAAWTPVPG
ncbi:MAG: hypothetical protein WBM17_08935 [Anaerolineales bacterium]